MPSKHPLRDMVRSMRANKARRARLTAKFTKNKKVNTVQRKAFVPKQVKNTVSIGILANQVKKLQLAQNGRLQSKIELWKFPTTTSTTWKDTAMWNKAPVAFALNDFTNKAQVWQLHGPLSTDTPGGDLLDTTVNKKEWEDFNGHFGTGDINERGGLEKYYSYWKTQQDNSVSNEYYLPISSTIQFEFARKVTPATQLECVRIDIIRPKKMVPMNANNYLQLPQGLMGMRGLASKEMLDRNRINRQYFDVIHTKYLYFNPRTTQHNTDDVTIRRQFKWTHKFPQKPLVLDLNAQRLEDKRVAATSATTVTNADGTTTTTPGVAAHDVPGDRAAFTDVMDPTKIFWAVVSFSNTDETDTRWSMSMMRTNKWRDDSGTD